MGFIRGGLVVIVSILMLVSLLTMNVFWTLNNSLEYNNLKTELLPVVNDFAESTLNLSANLEKMYPVMVSYCQNNSEFVLGQGEFTFTISCSKIKEGITPVKNKLLEDAMDSLYYKQYDCNFFDCFNKYQGLPFFIVSENTKDYFSSKFYLLVFVNLILLALLLLLTETRSNAFIISGVLMIISGIPFSKLSWILGMFAEKQYLQFFTFLFTQAFSIFVKCLILGAVLIAFGILWKIFSLGFRIKGFFDKFKGEKKEEKKSAKKE